MTLGGFRSFLYTFARLLGDVNAIRRHQVGRRIRRRVVGRMLGRHVRRFIR